MIGIQFGFNERHQILRKTFYVENSLLTEKTISRLKLLFIAVRHDTHVQLFFFAIIERQTHYMFPGPALQLSAQNKDTAAPNAQYIILH